MYFAPVEHLPPPESDRLLLAFVVALCLHIGLLLSITIFENPPTLPPIRIEAQMAQMQPEPPPVEAISEPEPEPPKPVVEEKPIQKPREITKPVLTAKDNSPALHEIPMQEQPEPTEPVQQYAPQVPVTAAPKSDSIAEAPKTAQPTGNPENAEPVEADPQEAWDNYGQLLHSMVAKNKIYPQIAIRRNLQGTAMVSARFNRGRLVSLVLLDPTSGHKVLDDAAMEMLKKAVSALPVKGDLAKKSFTVIVPVDFKLEG